MEKTASRGFSPLSAAASNLYYARLFPPARPLVLDALKRRLERHRAGLRAGREGRRGSGAGIGTHGGQGSACRSAVATKIRPAPGASVPRPPRAWAALPPGAAQKTIKGQQVRISLGCSRRMLGYLKRAAGVKRTAGRQGR